MKTFGSQRKCARKGCKGSKCSPLTLSGPRATSTVYLCEGCMRGAAEAWNRFLNGDQDGDRKPDGNSAT